MLLFEHPNVMSLIGVCLDGETPLLIMPFMSNGSVLAFVKSRKKEMFFPTDTMEEMVNYSSKSMKF